jgi:hypothetical protein
MGLNAQTTVPAFTAGQILTAAQQTNINTGIPVFADTTARDAAFGGTGEKVLAEGQYAYIEATNTTQFYDGSSWLPVGTTPGMVFITGAPFTAQGTISMPAGTFTTTYKTYKVFLQITASSTDLDVLCRVNASGTPNSTSGQYVWSKTGTFTNATENVQGNTNSQTSALINEGRNSGIMVAPCNDMTIYDPANASTFTQATGNWVGGIDNNGINAMGYHGFTIQTAAANDGLTFLTSTGTITGFYRVYGLNES